MKTFLLTALVLLAATNLQAAETATPATIPPQRPMVGGGVSSPWRAPWSLASIDPRTLSPIIWLASAATLLFIGRRAK